MAHLPDETPNRSAASKATSTLPDLFTLRVSNNALKGKELPSRIKIFDWGNNASIKGDFKVGDQSAVKLAANQRGRGFERVALDYNHCSVPGSAEYNELLKNGQPPIIFGYGRPHLVKGDGLYLEEMEWTPLGVEKARNFEDLSPAAANECGEVDFIHSVALTTNGCLHDVTFFSASTNQHTTDEDTNMSTQTTKFIALATLAGAFGLPPESDEAAVTKEFQTLSALKPLSALIKEGKVVAVPTEDFTALTNRVKAIEDAGTKSVALLSATVNGQVVNFTGEDVVKLAARLDKFEKDFKAGVDAAHAAEAGKVISLLSAEGKAPINPATNKPYAADDLAKLDLPTLKLLHANTPVTIPLSARNKGAQENTGIDPKLKGRDRVVAAFENQNRN